MTCRIPTGHLVGLLTDLALTAADPADSGATAAVLLHTARGYFDGEPGKSDLLVGTSTDAFVVGHAHIGCAGQVDPMLWPIAEVRAVIAVLKPLGKNADHSVEISRDGDTIKVAEDPNLFGEGLTVTFTGYAVDEWPVDAVRSMLTEVRTTPPADARAVAPRTDFNAARLAPFLKVASRRGRQLEFYRYHQSLPVVVQIGDAYRGVVSPVGWDGEDRSSGAWPAGDVYPLAVT